MAGIEIATKDFPFVFIRYAPQNATNAELEGLFGELRGLLERRERFVVLVDSSKPTSTSPMQRKMYADIMKELARPAEKYCAGIAVVIGNGVIRGAMQAVLWLYTPPTPLEVFGTFGPAVHKCAEWMRRESMPNADAPEHLFRSGRGT